LTIILIAVISSFFKKKKENSGQNRHKTNQPGSGRKQRQQNPFEEARDIFKELTRPVMQEMRLPKEKEEKKLQRPKKRGENAANRIGTESPPAGLEDALDPIQFSDTSLATAPQTPPEKKLEVKEEQLIDAVIWSEILGPPRAKNPYMKKNFRS